MENPQKSDSTVKHDEDVEFERDKESLFTPLTADENEQSSKDTIDQIQIPAKEDTLGNSDFPPLTELDKQPKLQESEESMADNEEGI